MSVVNRTAIVCGQAGPYALEAQNATLAAHFTFKQGVLENTRDAALDDLAQRVHDEAAALVAAQPAKMVEYGLKATGLADLQSAITAYSASLGVHTAASGRRVGITVAIAAEIDRADANLGDFLDRLILQFTVEHPQFVKAYQTARRIIDLGGSPGKKPTDPTEPAK